MAETPAPFEYEVSEIIRAAALSLPEVTEGTSCVNRAFKAGGKNFAFLGEKQGSCGLRLKLDASIADVERRAESEPDRYDVGTAGWTMIRFPPNEPPPAADLETWLVESFRLLAPKRVAAQLDDAR